MPQVLALDIALIPPPEIRKRAERLSRTIFASSGEGFTLDAARLAHITLTQQFVSAASLPAALASADEALRGQPPLQLRVHGMGRGGRSVWMAVTRTAAIAALHARLMQALEPFERAADGPDAFFERDARLDDVEWVGGYRHQASGEAFTPHITLGYTDSDVAIEPFEFQAATAAACHLGRYCTCRRILRQWNLT